MRGNGQRAQPDRDAWETLAVSGSAESVRSVPSVPFRRWQRFREWGGVELSTATFPELQWAVPGLLPEGLSLVAGSPKAGKSTLMLGLGLSVAGGLPALGTIPVRAGGVLYLSLEDSERQLQRRLNEVHGDRPVPDGMTFFTDWTRGEEAVEDVKSWLQDHPGTRLVVVDLLKKVRVPRRRSGDIYDEDYDTIAPWQEMAGEVGVAVAMVHHTRKASAEDFVAELSGTHGLSGAADTVMHLSRTRTQHVGSLKITSREMAERELTLHWVDRHWTMHSGPVPDPNLGDIANRVFAAVGTTPTTAAEVTRVTGLPVEKARRYLNRQVESGRLLKDGRGRFRRPSGDTNGTHRTDETHAQQEVTR